MKTLAVIRHTRSIPRAINSIRRMLLHSSLDALWLRATMVTGGRRYEDNTLRLQQARTVFLAGDWDAMLIVDDDLVIPINTFERLKSLGQDVTMALTVQRPDPHMWSAMVEIDGDHRSLSRYPDRAREAWGQVIEVAGCGHNPTLIAREVIERIPFEQRGPHGADRYFAYDCMNTGIKMWCDASLIVGHHDGQACWFPSIDPFHYVQGVPS